ncbi:MAG TPA: sigma-70 family RNA polymerase sigma factor, partial [Bryobacteraceae bacterium]
MELSDEAAVLAVRGGNRDAFRVLVERYSRSVFRLGYRMTGNEQDAEDVVQEAFLRAYKQLNRYESRSSFSTWLYRIAANYSLDLI